MYAQYATDPQMRLNVGIRRRLAPLMENNPRRIELMNSLLFTMPGTPIVYYGDEIGMGDNFYLGDRNGVRTPMQWSPDRNGGFSRANPHRLYLPVIIDPEYHYEAINVETQQSNPHSLLWWMRRLISLRKRYQAFGRGSIAFLQPENHKVLAFVRRFGDERILVVANLSRFVQHVELDLSEHQGVEPVELFGHSRFPRIGELPYLLTLGPHGFYWFSLGAETTAPAQRAGRAEGAVAERSLPVVSAPGGWRELVTGEARRGLEAALPEILAGRRWFGGKSRDVRRARIATAAEVPAESTGSGASGGPFLLALVEVEYVQEDPETYVLPLGFRAGKEGERLAREGGWDRWAALARVELGANRGGGRGGGDEDGGETRRKGVSPAAAGGVLYDALLEPAFCRALLDAIAGRRSFAMDGGTVAAWRGEGFRALRGKASEELAPRVLAAEQSNTSVAFGDRLVLKVIRKLEPGVNPDLELGRFLTERARFEHAPPVVGALELRGRAKEPATLAVLQGFVDNEGDAWRLTLDYLSRFFERVLTRREAAVPAAVRRAAAAGPGRPLEVALAGIGRTEEEARAEAVAPDEIEDDVAGIAGLYPTQAALLGQRTAELHRALSGAEDDPAFAPEPFGELYQRSLYESMRATTGKAFRQLRRSLRRLPEELRPAAEDLLGRREALLARFAGLLAGKIEAARIRTHGDYHLGQVLWTGKDFVIIDFEGEPARPLSVRRIKRSPLRDVAGMLRSFDYAVHAAQRELADRGVVAREQAETVASWGRLWYQESAAAFLRAYLETVRGSGIVPADPEHLRLLLDVYLLEKAVYELGYELDNRPGWVGIPLRGILELIEPPEEDR